MLREMVPILWQQVNFVHPDDTKTVLVGISM